MAKSKDAALEKLGSLIEAEKQKFNLALRGAIDGFLAECGVKYEDLLDVKGARKSASGVVAKVRKAPFKGERAAKYRDPKTGATWSGMGRAPGWIVNARNREKFLIETI